MREPGRVPGWSCRKESGEACSLIFWAAISSAIATKIKTLNIAEIGVTRNWIDLSSFVSLLETSFKGVQFFFRKAQMETRKSAIQKANGTLYLYSLHASVCKRFYVAPIATDCTRYCYGCQAHFASRA